jgi:hypothetical protein
MHPNGPEDIIIHTKRSKFQPGAPGDWLGAVFQFAPEKGKVLGFTITLGLVPEGEADF